MKITRKAFIGWLHDKGDFADIGDAGLPESCPIACFLHEQHSNLTYLSVGSEGVDYERGDRMYRVELPLWAKNFITSLDAVFAGEQINVDDAFNILDGNLDFPDDYFLEEL